MLLTPPLEHNCTSSWYTPHELWLSEFSVMLIIMLMRLIMKFFYGYDNIVNIDDDREDDDNYDDDNSVDDSHDVLYYNNKYYVIIYADINDDDPKINTYSVLSIPI